MFAVGDKLGAYVIRRRIGAGGMGEVYLAEHVHIGRKAAIKVLLSELSSRPDIVARFFTEARATGLLRHPNIVEILDCDVHASGRAYIVMEFLEGETLGRCLARTGNFAGDVSSAAAIAGQIAAALAAAHGKGIIHRDLKPDNIFLASTPEEESPIRIKILDFGIAKLLGEGASEASKTRTGSLLGTPIYMSPEQCRGAGRVDLRTDIYSLGCMMFELLAGRPPFVRDGHGELIIAHNSELPPELASLVPSVPAAFASLVAQMLLKDPGQRTQTMSEVVSSLEVILGVPLSQFASRVKPPVGFPVNGTDEIGQQDAITTKPTDVTPFTDRPVAPTVAAPASEPLPRTLVQAGKTNVLPRGGTTLSQAAVVLPDAAPAPPARLGLKLGFGAGALALIVVLFAAVSRRPAATETKPEQSAPPAPTSAVPTVNEGAPSPPGNVRVELEGAPDGLTVALDGKPTPVPIAIPAGSMLHDLRFEAPGFEPRVLKVDGSRDRSIVLDMKPVTVAPAAVKAPAPAQPSPPPSAKAQTPPRSKPKRPGTPDKHDTIIRDF